jgi:molybdopterin molybdotransferase
VLSTGDELTPRGAPPEPGRVRDVNSLTVALLARRAGAEPVSFGIVRDDREALAETLDAAWRECDAVLLSGGSSGGARDLAVRALEGFADAEILVHGVSMSPGKPAILARRGDRPVLGLPGQVGAALVVMRVLGVPLLRHLGGEAGALEHGARPELRAVLARNAAARQGREEFVRVRLEARPGGLPLAHPLPGPSGLLRTLVAADGLAVIPAGDEGAYAGQEVDVLLL